jgi:hypothetical protein
MDRRDRHAPANGVLLVADGDIPTTHIVFAALRAAFPASPDWIAYSRMRADDASACPLLFSRVCAPEIRWLPRWLRRNGARYAFYLDDNLWHFEAPGAVGDYYRRREVVTALDSMIGSATRVLVSSTALAREVATRFPNVPVLEVPAPFDFSLVDAALLRRDRSRAKLRVGYAGSERGSAFEPVCDAIEHLLRHHGDRFEFEFIGYIPDRLRDHAGVAYFPAVADYGDFIAFKQSREWDVGLAPLPSDRFAAAKTDNKFREYGALQIAGLYSDTPPYRDRVRDGVDGVLVADGADAWVARLLEFESDREYCRRIGRAARGAVEVMCRPEAVAGLWREALQGAGLRPARRTRAATVTWHCSSALARARGYLEGWRNDAATAGRWYATLRFVKRALARLARG